MKNIVLAVIAAALIFTGTESFARGFSVGVFGAYSIDGGNIAESIDEKRYQEFFSIQFNFENITKSEYDTIIIPGAGAFLMYQFSNGMFIRTGAEFYTLVSGGDVSKSVGQFDEFVGTYRKFNYNYNFDYKATAAPLLFGLSVSPDKGRTSLYAAVGIIAANVEINRETSFEDTQMPSNEYEYTSENDSIIVGFAGIIGLEKKIIGSMSILIEYAFYKCEENREESGNFYLSQLDSNSDYQYTERYGLPRQQARLGVKYSF